MEENRIEVKSGETTNAYLWTYGDKNNPPLLLVPGFTGTHGDLIELAGFLTKKYFVMIPDMPGWGQSPRFEIGLTIENYAEFIESVLEQLKIEKVSYAGHCMGASIGIELAFKHPGKVEKLFLISTPYLGDNFYHKLLIFAADTALKFPKKVRPLFYLWRNRYIGAIANIFIIRLRGKMKKLKLILHYVLIQGKPDENSVEEAWHDIIHFSYAKLREVKVPVHIIHGNEDILLTKNHVKKLNDYLPSATVDYILNCGHMPPAENPEGVAEVILKY